MGGLVCSACHPPRTDADCVLRLVIRGGLWDDADNPFDNFAGQEEAADRPAATATTTKNTGLNPVTNFDEATTSELATPREGSANKPTSRRVGEPLLDLELDFYFNLPSACDGSWLGPEVISARMIGEESQTERKRTGLLESSALDCGFVGGFVRRGQGVGPWSQPAATSTINTQFAVGQVVRLMRRLETFRGFLQPGGGYRISSIGKDCVGCPLVALSLGGAVVVSGLVPDAETIAVDEVISIDDLIG